jgi:hypothetical protein
VYFTAGAPVILALGRLREKDCKFEDNLGYWVTYTVRPCIKRRKEERTRKREGGREREKERKERGTKRKGKGRKEEEGRKGKGGEGPAGSWNKLGRGTGQGEAGPF